MAEEIGFENGRNSNFQRLVTLTLTLFRPLKIRPYGIPSCITHRPLPIYQISFKSKKLFVDGRTYGRTDGRTFSPSNIIRSTFGSRPNKVGLPGAPIKNNPLEKNSISSGIVADFFHQIYAVYRGGFRN